MIFTSSSRLMALLSALLLMSCAVGRPPTGSVEKLSDAQKAAIARVKSQVQGLIVWSSSRVGNHDLFLMKSDGTGRKALTKGKHVDWFPRFSPDGKRILFARSRAATFVYERDSNKLDTWDLYTIAPDGSALTKIVDNASWGTWVDDQTLLFARGQQVVRLTLADKKEEVLADSTKVEALGGASLQNPYLSADGKYLAITLRGSKRATGIYSLQDKSWTKTGEGCQINFFPQGDRIIWVNPSGNGGSEVFSVPIKDGKPVAEFSYEKMRFIDIPGRRSHEYFPKLDKKAEWMVWAATRRGHDHDIADYEVFIWKVGSPAEHATRLTFHSGNDRWPDIFIP